MYWKTQTLLAVIVTGDLQPEMEEGEDFGLSDQEKFFVKKPFGLRPKLEEGDSQT